MGIDITSRFKNAWNAFTSYERNDYPKYYESNGYSYRPDRPRLTRGNERSIVTAIYNRVAIDVSNVRMQHVKLDNAGRFKEVINSPLNTCLTLEANIDQTSRSFIQDVVMSMFDEGSVAIVPEYTSANVLQTEAYKIYSLRTAKIVEWKPNSVRMLMYDGRTGLKNYLTLPKRCVAIIENPLYAVINEPNSTLQRLIRKLNLLDMVDEQSSSGKLDLIFQVPYSFRNSTRKQMAANRTAELEGQLKGSKYGIGYIDTTEKVIQLNRPIDNNLMKQVEYLTNVLYSQLGISESVLNGAANEKEMLNYNNRTVEPIISAIVDELKRKFISTTARTQLQSISTFKEPFKFVPVTDVAEISDKFTRNEIMTANEIRQELGILPSDDPKADRLENSNISRPNEVTVDTNNQEDIQ